MFFYDSKRNVLKVLNMFNFFSTSTYSFRTFFHRFKSRFFADPDPDSRKKSDPDRNPRNRNIACRPPWTALTGSGYGPTPSKTRHSSRIFSSTAWTWMFPDQQEIMIIKWPNILYISLLLEHPWVGKWCFCLNAPVTGTDFAGYPAELRISINFKKPDYPVHPYCTL